MGTEPLRWAVDHCDVAIKNFDILSFDISSFGVRTKRRKFPADTRIVDAESRSGW
jgi:hypothetical protein